MIAAAALAVGLSAPAFAEERQFKQSDAVSIQADTAYLLIRSNAKVDLTLIRRPDDQQLAEWGQKRAEAYVKAKKKNEKAWKQYNEEIARWNELDPDMKLLTEKPEKPAVLTEENFFYPPPELANFVTVFGGRVFSKGDDGPNSYFIAVRPGSYALYRVGLGPCLCMGSVRFDAPAGKISYVGDFEDKLVPPGADVPKPPQLASMAIEPAKFHAAGKMPNYFGTLIDRMPAMAGVLDYRRDMPLDVASGNTPIEPLH
jgi:hypothetical protein